MIQEIPIASAGCMFAPSSKIAMECSGSDAISFSIDFNRETETFARYPVPFVRHISQDGAGMLWLATVKGLYSLDPATGTIRQYLHHPHDPSSLSNNDVKSSGEDREGRFWVATSGHLDEFDRRTGKVTRDISLPEALSGFAFYEDRFGVFWIFHDSPTRYPCWTERPARLPTIRSRIRKVPTPP